ncbi:hypothetical protein [Rhodopirellula baltica]|uniref:Uncharacterized protein n=1 Tax=Rhodopirellula baltica WH47 TaxID=991778 RepID=F2AT97_RHOBT|nr:hypothetical protein [Rhodopirellula baltica]EGF27119.1 hypothetical protein RBWH47_03205 [Rhodopirellula baltica WH47]
MARQAGLLTLDGTNFCVEPASCRFVDGLLSLTLRATDCQLYLPLIPFGDAGSISQLVGHSWCPSSDDLNASDTLNEGGYIVIRDTEFVPHTLSVRCTAVDPSERWATFDFAMSGRFDDDDAFHDLAGFADCRIDNPPCSHCGEPLRSANAQQCFACGAVWR